jgi:hypothetical protein
MLTGMTGIVNERRKINIENLGYDFFSINSIRINKCERCLGITLTEKNSDDLLIRAMNYSDEIIRCYVILFSDLEKSVADAMICIWLYVYIRFL